MFDVYFTIVFNTFAVSLYLLIHLSICKILLQVDLSVHETRAELYPAGEITLPEGSRWIFTHFHFGSLHTLHTLHIIAYYIDHAYSLLHTLHRDHIDHINYGTPCIYARCAIIDIFYYCIIFFSIILIISSNNQ